MTKTVYVPMILVVLASSGPAASASAPAGLEGYHEIWSATVDVDGKAVTSPPLRWEGPDTYRVQLTGMLGTGTFGERLDARFKTSNSKFFRHPHDFLVIEPGEWLERISYRKQHRYIFSLDGARSARPARVRVSFEGLAYFFRVSPSRIRRELTGTLRVSIWKKGPPPGSGRGWPVWVGLGLGLGLFLLVFLTGRAERVSGKRSPRDD